MIIKLCYPKENACIVKKLANLAPQSISLHPINSSRFPDGEWHIPQNQNLSGCLYYPCYPQPHEKLLRLYFLLETYPQITTVVIPYLPYNRQYGGKSPSLFTSILKLLTHKNRQLVTIDSHESHLQVQNLSPVPYLVAPLKREFSGEKISTS